METAVCLLSLAPPVSLQSVFLPHAMAQFGTATQTGVVTVHVYEVQDVPLDTMTEVVLHWKYGQLEGYGRRAVCLRGRRVMA